MTWLAARTTRRRVFWVYAIVLFILTHWPRLEVKVPGVERPDLIAHLTVFGLWYTLFFAAAFFGPLGGSAVRTVAAPWAVSVVYACFDEALQLIPMLGRHAAWDDLAANLAGLTLAAGACLVWSRRFRATARQESAA